MATPRSAAEWRAYDRANIVVLTLLGVLAFGLLALRATPQVPAAPAPAAAGTPAPFEIFAARGWVRLSGSLPDAPARQALLDAAGATFGPDRVIDQIAVSALAPRADWTAQAPQMMSALQVSTEPAGIRVNGAYVTLTGTVAQPFMVDGRAAQARQWFGNAARIDNQVQAAAAAAEPASASAPASASTSVSPATPGSEPAARTAAAASAAAPASGAAGADPICQRLASGLAVAFKPNQAALAPAGKRVLDDVAGCLGNGRWRVGGHTDSHGDEASNLRLTGERAEAVQAYLVKRGVAAERLSAQGFGSSRPVADNDSNEGRQLNRRITVEPAS